MQFSLVRLLHVQLTAMLPLGYVPGTRHLSQMAFAICIPFPSHHVTPSTLPVGQSRQVTGVDLTMHQQPQSGLAHRLRSVSLHSRRRDETSCLSHSADGQRTACDVIVTTFPNPREPTTNVSAFQPGPKQPIATQYRAASHTIGHSSSP